MYEQNKKVILTREEIVQQIKLDQLVEFFRTVVAEGFFIGFCALVTWNTVANWNDHTWFVRITLVLMTVLLWCIAVLVANTIVQYVIRMLYLNQGKYVIEIDRVKLLVLKTEEEYKVSRSGRGGRTEIVTNQYVYFEKYGKVKSGRPLANGQECYLLAVQTKKPHVLKFWECDIHEIKGM